MGLNDIVIQELKTLKETKNIKVLKFILDNNSFSKQKIFENFLTRFINIIKSHVYKILKSF